MGCFELLHKIKRKSGDDPKEEDDDFTHREEGGQPTELLIPALSVKSKAAVNLADEIEALALENN